MKGISAIGNAETISISSSFNLPFVKLYKSDRRESFDPENQKER